MSIIIKQSLPGTSLICFYFMAKIKHCIQLIDRQSFSFLDVAHGCVTRSDPMHLGNKVNYEYKWKCRHINGLFILLYGF